MKRLITLMGAVCLLIYGCSKDGALPSSPPPYGKSTPDNSNGPSGKSTPANGTAIGSNQAAQTSIGFGNSTVNTPPTSFGGGLTGPAPATVAPTSTLAPLPESWYTFKSSQVSGFDVQYSESGGEFTVLGILDDGVQITVDFTKRPTANKVYGISMDYSTLRTLHPDSVHMHFDAEGTPALELVQNGNVKVDVRSTYTRLSFNNLEVLWGPDSILPYRLSGELYFR